MSGRVLWTGPSAWNGVPLVVVATIGSRNVKTGNMVQTWILVRDVRPAQVVQSSVLDAAICGTCPHRHPRSCYVAVHQAPTAIWDTYQRGAYRMPESELLWAVSRDGIRLGAYGDPGMVPPEVWEPLVERAATHTGYSHMWRELDQRRWARLVMASCETQEDVRQAKEAGWSTYRVGPESPAEHEIQCPENLSAIMCQRCGLCSGTRRSQRHIWAEKL